MGTLYVGTEGIVVKDAIKQVNRNIFELQEKLDSLIATNYLTSHMKGFYEAKLESQKITLGWLESAL